MNSIARIPNVNQTEKLRVAVMVSGRGTNLQALLESHAAGRLPLVDFRVVISNRDGAGGLLIAEKFGIPTAVVEHRGFGRDRSAHEEQILQVMDTHDIQFVVLAGYMRLLTPTLLDRFENRIINIHPSLLPAFPGVNAQRQALDYGVKIAGCTAHFVTGEMDTGPIILQRQVKVLPGDTQDSLQQRILVEEHKALPHALDLASRRRLHLHGRHVRSLVGPSSFPELESDIDAVFPIFVATGNAHKREEIGAILTDLPLFLQGTDEIDAQTEPAENAPDYLGNAQIKAHFWQRRVQSWCLADDSGLEVDALDGRPGIHSARYAPTTGSRIDRLLQEMKGVPEGKRTARFVCTVVLCGPNGEEFSATGKCEGRIAQHPRGDFGFGYDPVFIPDGFDGSHLAELSTEVKNTISHRALALKQLRPRLEAVITDARGF